MSINRSIIIAIKVLIKKVTINDSFDKEAHAQAYLEIHVARLTAAGVIDIRSKMFLVNAALS